MKKYLIPLLIITLQTMASGQSNGIVVQVRVSEMGLCNSDSGITTLTYMIRKDILRLNISGPSANSSIIFQPSSDKVWMLYHHERVFFSMTREEMRTLDADVERMGREMKETFDSMSEDQKSSTRNIWKDGNPFTWSSLEYETVKKKDSLISQLICKEYTATLDGGRVRYVYINPLKDIGVKDNELEILTAFYEFMGKGLQALLENNRITTFRKWDLKGYPILLEDRLKKEVCTQVWMSALYRGQMESELFKIPAEYARNDNPLGN